MIGSEREPFAFVSSLTADHFETRRRLFDLGESCGRYVWVCEHERCRADLYGRDPLEIADTLVDRVRRARHYIALLGGTRHGTSIIVGERPSSVSHFEVELFAAAMAGRRITVLVAEGFAPGPRMAALLRLLEWALPRERWEQRLSQDAIIRRVEALLTEPQIDPTAAATLPRDFGLRRRLVQGFYRRRSDSRPLFFLDGQFEDRPQSPDLDLVDELLAQATQALDQERRLSRIWMALRELMAAAQRFGTEPRVLLKWNLALGQWAKAASWYGLHAHIYLGALAAIGSAAQARTQLRECPNRTAGLDPRDLAHPSGALASATYSIAKYAPWWERRAMYRDVLLHLEHPERLRGSLQDDSDVKLIRASTLLRLGSVWDAKRDYRAALDLREREGNPARIGEALSELGFACLFTLSFGEGLNLLRRGEALLGTHQVPGFHIRAKRKLAWGLYLCGQRAAAKEQRAAADLMADQHRMYDQL